MRLRLAAEANGELDTVSTDPTHFFYCRGMGQIQRENAASKRFLVLSTDDAFTRTWLTQWFSGILIRTATLRKGEGSTLLEVSIE